MLPAPEVQARQQIDAQLVAAGGLLQNVKTVNLSAGPGIALHEVQLKTGPCNYLLRVDRHPIGMIETKKVGTTLSGFAEQSADYASALPDFLATEIVENLCAALTQFEEIEADLKD